MARWGGCLADVCMADATTCDEGTSFDAVTRKCVVDTTACTEGTMFDAVTKKYVPDLAQCYGVRNYWGAYNVSS